MAYRIERLFPLVGTLARYRREDLRADVTAGLTTAVMLVPQGMAYALLAGLPPVIGVYAALVPATFYAAFGTSRQLSVGPVAIDSLLVAASVGGIAQAGSDDYLAAAIVLGALVGLLQLVMGLLRMGFVVNFLSTPVVSGFTSAAAIVIGLSQVKHLLGIDGENTARLVPLLQSIVSHIEGTDPRTAGLGGGAIVTLVLVKRYFPRVPAALFAVSAGALLVLGLGWQDSVAIVGEVPAGLPPFSLPEAPWVLVRDLLPAAATIALVSFMESISVGKTYAQRNKYALDPNRELIALGAANLAGSFFHGYPVAGGFSRTAVHASAGARTQLAALVTSLAVAASLMFLTPLFFYMPKAVLAAIIVSAVVGLVDLREVQYLKRVKREDLALLGVTFGATLGLGVVQGIGVGVGASLVWFVFRTTRPHVAVLGRVPGTRLFRNVSRQKGLITYAGVLIVRMDAQFYFGNVSFLRDALRRAEEQLASPLRAVVLDASAINQLDSSAETALAEMWEDYDSRGVRLVLASVKGPVRDVLEASGLAQKLGSAGKCMSVFEALDLLDAEPEERVPPAPPTNPQPDVGARASRASARL